MGGGLPSVLPQIQHTVLPSTISSRRTRRETYGHIQKVDLGK